MTRSLRPLSVGLLVGLLAMPAAADDKDFLRPRADSVPPNLLIVFGNSQTMTQTISFTGVNFSTFDGDGDSPGSKMGSGKRVVQQFINDNSTRYNIGLTTFAHNPNAGSITISRKHWVYVAVGTVGTGTRGLGKVDYPGDTFAEPVGTLERWGTTGGGGPCTTLTVPDCSDRSPKIALTATGSDKATVVGPFFGPMGDGTAFIYLNGGSASNATARIQLNMTAGDEYGDGYTDDFSAFTRGTYSVKVLKTYQTRPNANAAWPQGASDTPAGNSGAVEVLYRPLGAPIPPSAAAPDTTLFYPTGAVDNFGNSIAGQSVGFLNDPQSDFSVSANCSGWEFQTNSAQVPLVKIPRDYYWGEACSAPQDSVPCVKRLLRPQAYIENYDKVTGTFSTHDPDNKGYTTGVSGDRYLDGCDPSLLGAVQAGLDLVENNAVLTTRNGSQAPIKNLLDNILAYFSNPTFDGFKNGVRQDDPNAICRKSAVILIYDNFNGCQNDKCNQLKTFNLNKLKALGIRVYTIGFGAGAQSSNSNADCTGPEPGESCPLVCIPKNTNAVKTNGKPGYFPVNSPVQLYNALTSIANLVNESQKGFVSATVSSGQVSGDQITFLATFQALNQRSIWNGRINAYKLDAAGNLLLGTRTIQDPLDPNNGVMLPAPSNDPSSLMWNAGENLAQTPGTGATVQSARLQPGAPRTTGTYDDNSNDGPPTSIGTSFYPGRKVVFSLPTTYPPVADPTTRLPFPPADTVPENRYDMIYDTSATWWPAIKALLSPQSSPPLIQSPVITDADARDSLSFIWGDRDPIILAADSSAVNTTKLYGDADEFGVTDGVGGLKLGDVFHSSPVLVGPPGNFAYFTTNLNNYQAFRTTYQHRRRMLYFGANDGLFHGLDAGGWDRTPAQCGLEDDGVTRKHCYDLGSGAELFAYAPRAVMQIFKALKDRIGIQTRRMEWTLDGPATAGDVFIDSNHSGTPAAGARAWHTILVGGMREGSPFEGTSGKVPADSQGSYYALDVTQPDPLTTDANGNPVVVTPATFNAPLCLDSSGDPTCARSFPTVLWEMTDIGDLDASGTTGATYVDMGETWSKPALGRVKVCTENCGNSSPPFPVTEDHYVAIFGGGFDRERLNRRGNWLYMVDVETGRVLYRANSSCGINSGGGCSPIYFGSIPSEPAAIDGNGDGLIDVIYVGDLRGRMWRIDTSDLRQLSSPPSGDRFENRIDFDRGSGKPFLVFEAPQPASGNVHPFYPIYYRPSVIALGFNVGGRPAVGLAFGTGDRDDITSAIEPASLTYKQRFYYVVDRNNNTTRTESDLLDIPASNAASVATAPANGWFLEFALGERANADVLTTGSVIFFTTFNPLAAGNATNLCAQNTPECGLANGTARLYRVSYATGNPYLGNDRGETQLYGGFLSEPIRYQSKDQAGDIMYTTENTVKKENAPGGKKTSVKSWKERSRRP